MKKLTVKKIRSVEGMTALHNAVKTGNKFEDLIVTESSTDRKFENIGGFNGNPWDLWLRKVGTMGATYKTFIRLSVGKNLEEKIEFEKSMGRILSLIHI